MPNDAYDSRWEAMAPKPEPEPSKKPKQVSKADVSEEALFETAYNILTSRIRDLETRRDRQKARIDYLEYAVDELGQKFKRAKLAGFVFAILMTTVVAVFLAEKGSSGPALPNQKLGSATASKKREVTEKDAERARMTVKKRADERDYWKTREAEVDAFQAAYGARMKILEKLDKADEKP